MGHFNAALSTHACLHACVGEFLGKIFEPLYCVDVGLMYCSFADSVVPSGSRLAEKQMQSRHQSSQNRRVLRWE
eukprot:scaffold155774_cov34-Prasinocladus_malaysianus.AAC.2